MNLKIIQAHIWEFLLLVVSNSTCKVLSTRVFFDGEKPVSQCPQCVHCVHHTDVVHSTCGNRHERREREENQGEKCPCDGDDVGKVTKAAQPEASMLDVVTAAIEQAPSRNQVTQQQESDTSNHHGVESSAGCQVQAAQNSHNC